MAHREFLVPTAEVDPPSFTVFDQTFVCLPQPPAGSLTDVIAMADGSAASQAAAVPTFFASILSDEDAERFNTLIHAKDRIVPLDMLVEILQWIVQEYTNRPTTPSSLLPPGANTQLATSEDGSPSPASTPVAAIS